MGRGVGILWIALGIGMGSVYPTTSTTASEASSGLESETFFFDSEELFEGGDDEGVIGEKRGEEEWEGTLFVYFHDLKKEISSESSSAYSKYPRRYSVPAVPRNAKRPKVTQRENEKKETEASETAQERGDIAEQPISKAEKESIDAGPPKTLRERRAEKMRAVRAQRPKN